MAIYDFSNFERQGSTYEDIQLSSIAEIKQAVIEHTQNTLRTIKMFSPDLESEIYNNNEFRKSLLDFARGNRHAKIEILVNDITTALHEGHHLINLARQIPSIMTIKDTPLDYHSVGVAFIVFDQNVFIFKPIHSQHTAIFADCKSRGNKLVEFFTSLWEYAEINENTKKTYI